MTALASLNGQPILALRVLLPFTGAWTADVLVDSSQIITGQTLLNLDGTLKLAGTVRRGAPYADRGSYRLVGGAGGLTKKAKVKAYRGPTFRTVAKDILDAAGETLSGACDSAILNATLTSWAVFEQPAGQAFASLVDSQPKANWRVLPDGSIWVGVDPWPEVSLEGQVLAQDMHLGRAVLDLPRPTILPGCLLAGRNISNVQYGIAKGQGFRTTVWIDDK